MLLERAIGFTRTRLGTGKKTTRPLAIYSGVSLDLLSDGIMIGTGSVLNPALGLLLALGQVPADIPEGFAATATLRQAGYRRTTRLLMSASFAIPVLLGAGVGYLALRHAPDILTLSVVAATGGVITSVVIEEMINGSPCQRHQPLRPTAAHHRLRPVRPHLHLHTNLSPRW